MKLVRTNKPLQEILIEGNKHHTQPQHIASALNRQYIKKIKKIINEIPYTQTNPLDLY